MSENLKEKFQHMTNDELIDFALEHLGQENEAIRHAALQEHYLRIKDDPNTLTEPAGEYKILISKFKHLL